MFTEVTVYECYLKCNLYIHVPIIGRALKMTSVFLYFCLLEINQEEKKYLSGFVFLALVPFLGKL